MDHHQHRRQEEWSCTSTTTTGGGVPPGFRFHPTEEELVGYYLARKVLMASSSSSPPHKQQQIDLDDIIQEVDLYRIEPWDLQERCSSKNAELQTTTEWYFFSYKDRKYPSGTRTNRATAAGFWKATGRDKPVLSTRSIGGGRAVVIGMRKTLVFYRGRAPNGRKTEWIMHEYRLQSDEHAAVQEEGWVVCRAFHKPVPNHQQSRPPCSFVFPGPNYAYATTMPLAGYYDYDHHHHHDLLGSSSALLHHPAATAAGGINNIIGAGFPIPPQSSLYSSSAASADDDDLQLESKKHHLCFSGILPQLENPTSADDGSSVAQRVISYHPTETEQHDEQLILQQQQADAGAIDWSFLDTLLATTSHQLQDYPL
ncbi:hypothetical protein U9M48_034397 [Paspalum notatum var. saurae]|uniref:NAC domain-containing protein n=1 Tax=Paspalum notatum var. saurae TaxID=547442 RepID=A0AAQ3X7X8_PASNO